MALRVVARFQREAAGAPGGRKDTRELMKSVNRLKGITKSTVKDSVVTDKNRSESTKPHRNDLRPQDVFQLSPDNMGVRSLVDEGWPGVSDDYQGMEKAIRKQIPKDKGYDTVKNLSQFLIETGGGGGTKPVGK